MKMAGCYVLLVLLVSVELCWSARLCCDPACSGVISYGTTITRHISKDPDYLSFPRNALVEVYAKNNEDDPDVWLVKYGNKKGYVPQRMIMEKTVTCDNLMVVEDEVNDGGGASPDQEVTDNNGDAAAHLTPSPIVSEPAGGSHDARGQESHDNVVTPTGGVNKEWETIQDNGQPEQVGRSEQWNEPFNEQVEAVSVEQDERVGVDVVEQVPRDDEAADDRIEEGNKDEEEDERDLYDDDDDDDEYKNYDGEEVINEEKEDDDDDDEDYGEEKEDIIHKDDSEDVTRKGDDNEEDEHKKYSSDGGSEGVSMDHTTGAAATGSHGYEEMESSQQQPPSSTHGNQVDEAHADKPPLEDKPHTESEDIPSTSDGNYPIDDGIGNIRKFPEEEDPRVFEEIAKQLAANDDDDDDDDDDDVEWEELYEKQLNQQQPPDDQERRDHQAEDESDYQVNGNQGHQDMPDHQDRSDERKTLDQERQIDQEMLDHSKQDHHIENQDQLEHQEIPAHHERPYDHSRHDDQVRPDGLAYHDTLDVHDQQERLDGLERPEDHNRPDQQDRLNQQDRPGYQDRPEDYVTQFPSYTTSDVEPSPVTTEHVDQSEHVMSVTMASVTTTPVTMEEETHKVPVTEEPTGGGLSGMEHDQQHNDISNDRVFEHVEEMKKDYEIPNHDNEIPKYDGEIPKYGDEIEKHNEIHNGDVPTTEPERRDTDEQLEQSGGQNYEEQNIETTTDVGRDEIDSEMQQRDKDLHRDEEDEREDLETHEKYEGGREDRGEDLEIQKKYESGGENNLEMQEDGGEKYKEMSNEPEEHTDSLRDTETTTTFNEDGAHTTPLPHQQYEEDLNTANPQYGHPAHNTQEPPQHHYTAGGGVSPDVSEHLVTPSVSMTTVTHHLDDHTDEPTVEVYHKPHPTHRHSDDVTSHHHSDDDITTHRHSDDITSHHHSDDNVAAHYYHGDDAASHHNGDDDVTGHHGWLQDALAPYLPAGLAELLLDMDSATLYAFLGTLAAILFPCCLMNCRSNMKSNRHRKELERVKASCRGYEEKIASLENDKDQLQRNYNTEQAKRQSTEESLSTERQNIMMLQQANNEANLSLTHLQTQLQQCQQQVDQLVGELTNERQLHANQLASTQDAQQQLITTGAQLQQVTQQVAELEATREQLEQDLFTAKQSLEELQSAHVKVQQLHEEASQRCDGLDGELVTVRDNLRTSEVCVKEKDDELKLLRECLQQLQSDDSEGEDDQTTNGGGDVEKKTLKNSKLERVQAMLDTTKVQTELRTVREERDTFQQQLQSQIFTSQQLEGELHQTKTELEQLQTNKDELSARHSETQIKLKALTEYFETKEQNLHRKLGVEEAARQEIETREATAKEKVSLAEEERVKERMELQQLRQHMSDIEKSLMQQVSTNEKRAQDALSQLRRTEQELRLANREINMLKKKLPGNDGSRPDSPGSVSSVSLPPGPRQRYSPQPERYQEPVPVRRRPPSTGPRMDLTSRPLSAPRFPRTSSPSEYDHQRPLSTRQLNDTYPGPPRSLPQPHPSRDSYSLDDRDRPLMRGPEGKGYSLPPHSLHHPGNLPPPRLPMDTRPMPMSDKPPFVRSGGDYRHPPPPRPTQPPHPIRADHPMMGPPHHRPSYHPPGHRFPPDGPSYPPPVRRPGPPPQDVRQEPVKGSEQQQHKMEV
ncbi:melanoma inhibitory activity protein 2-like isoform X2 [Dysidea avara]|uniref:melanoma inhibitory activity protein 2-like isoform X2 n=1 Tax=Dysidea avara TaxID=196820 RepID=UPI003322DC0F